VCDITDRNGNNSYIIFILEANKLYYSFCYLLKFTSETSSKLSNIMKGVNFRLFKINFIITRLDICSKTISIFYFVFRTTYRQIK